MKLLSIVTGLLLIAAPLHAQTLSQLKKELKAKEVAAKTDPEGLVDAAAWAKEKGLVRDAQRILQAVLRLDKDNEAANEMLGFVRWEGEWVTKAKAETLQKRALEVAMKAKGFVEVEGVWVAKDEVADAKKGTYWHDGEKVTRTEKMAFAQGKVRHSVTGEFIDPDDIMRAEQGMFPLANGRWGDVAEADKFHAEPATPWLFRTNYATLISNRPLAELKDLAIDLDSSIGDASRIFAGMKPTPANRPLILMARDTDQYKELGTAVGAEGSAYAVFPALGEVEVRGLGTARPVVMNWDKDWGPYWLRHAGGLAWIQGMAADLDTEVPLWFLRGVGGLAERFFGVGQAQHFGRQHLEKGGVNSLQSWFNSFAISPDLEPRMLDYNVFQAGLMFSFAMDGGDGDATKALGQVTEAAREGDGKRLVKAIEHLESLLVKKQDAVREHLRKLVNG